MDTPVQEQMRTALESLNRKKDAGVSPEELASAYGGMGNLLLAAEYAESAEPCYLNAQALAPSDRRWPYLLGHVYKTNGDLGSAAAAFERTLSLAPNDVATLVWLGNIDLDQGNPEAADALFARASAAEPRSVAPLVGEGRAALARHDFARAADRFEQALAIDPRASIVHYPLALAYRGLGDLVKADAHARQRGDVEVGPPDPLMQELTGLLHSAASFEKRGLRALDAGDWAGAAAAFRSAIALAPDNGSLHHRLGTALSLSGDRAGATAEFQEAIRRAPDYAPSHFSLGVLLASSGRDRDAAEQFSSALRSEPNYAEARLQLAAALIRTERYKEAYEQLVEGQRRNPERPEFARALAQFQRR